MHTMGDFSIFWSVDLFLNIDLAFLDAKSDTRSVTNIVTSDEQTEHWNLSIVLVACYATLYVTVSVVCLIIDYWLLIEF